jgi:hypothetical protein
MPSQPQAKHLRVRWLNLDAPAKCDIAIGAEWSIPDAVGSMLRSRLIETDVLRSNSGRLRNDALGRALELDRSPPCAVGCCI